MPLHDWANLPGWDGMHLFWMSELARHIKEQLPPGFRAYLGSGPAVAIGAPPARPDVSVRSQSSPNQVQENPLKGTAEQDAAPDVEIAVATLEIEPSLLVERDGRLVAAVEIISPRNKDRPLSRTTYGRRYAGYLLEGVNLLLVDIQPRPVNFSFADFIAAELQIPDQPALQPPMCISYRVGEPAPTGGRFLAIWRHFLKVGAKLPSAILPLDVNLSVTVDQEGSYMRAARDAYLS
jgi:Protein of unknown function (DUF4058)